MKQMTLWTAILILVVLLSVPCGINAADNGVLPFTFSSGTPARASEVNTNFNHVNYGNLILIDGTGAELGTNLTTLFNGSIYPGYINSNGYTVPLDTWTSPMTPTIATNLNVYYTTSNCTGSSYAIEYFPGIVFSSNGLLYYLPKNALPVNIALNSQMNNNYCLSYSGTFWAYNILINDPSVTGESSLTKAGPVRIIRRR